MQAETDEADRGSRYWALRGVRGIFSAPALILMMSMTGFAALARDAGLTWEQATFMTATIWALPAKIIVVGAVTAGTSLPAAALAVALSSVRLMPMVVALVPEMRAPGTRTRTLYFLSHFVAITAWVFAMERFSSVPRVHRATFFAAFAITLTAINTLLVAFTFNLMGQLPALATGALAFLTPAYFFMSLFGSARDTAGRIGLFIGMALIPPANWLAPQVDILVAGIVGGVLAYLIGRRVDAARGRP